MDLPLKKFQKEPVKKTIFEEIDPKKTPNFVLQELSEKGIKP